MNAKELTSSWFEFGMALRLGCHYHQERRRFFERWNNLSAFAGVVFSSAALATFKTNNTEFAIWLTLFVAVVQAANLVVGFSRKAWNHGDLMKKFVDLEMEWRRADESVERLVELQAKRLELEKQEPTPMPYLVQRCHIDLMRRNGYPKEQWPKLGWWKRMLAQYLPELG